MRRLFNTLFLSGAVLLCLVCLAVRVCVYVSTPYSLRGPDSPTGLEVVVRVSDCGIGWSADFYTDVEVRNQAGHVVARWEDPGGQYPRGGPEHLVNSMKWRNDSLLEFEGIGGPVRLSVPKAQSNQGMQQPTTAKRQ